MIVYSNSKKAFLNEVRLNKIHDVILTHVKQKLSRTVAANEVASWKNSMQFMHNVLLDDDIPGDAKVAIEYGIPLTSKRVDFILTGVDADGTESAVIIELKQWQNIEVTEKDALVKTVMGGGLCETTHPSYQAWSYARLIQDYNETVRDENIQLQPCTYLHNMTARTQICDPFYKPYIDDAPVFISSDVQKLADFIKKYVVFGDKSDIMYRIENGRIKPSKALADALASMMKGNQEFLMVDDQKVVFESALDLSSRIGSTTKHVLLVEGGPGTGKSVVAVNLLVALTTRGLTAQYISKNAAPRAVYEARLKGTIKKSNISNLFRGSGGFTESDSNIFDVLIVDEAHRLNEKSGLYSNLGENQIKELINASKLTVFFLDEDQRVTLSDIGSKAEIIRWAHTFGATVTQLKLESQFRCNGSDGYIAWLDNVLGIRDTANYDLDGIDYDFQVFDDPVTLHKKIIEKNTSSNRSRMVAGYCWDWNSDKNPSAMDVVIPEHDYAAQWNLKTDGSLWIMAKESVQQVGCIHTCQGLELDYVGVLIGNDLVVRDGEIITDAYARAGRDKTVRGFKKQMKTNPVEIRQRLDALIKNTYKTLMTRGQKGCYVFCTDPETNAYFKESVQGAGDTSDSSMPIFSLPANKWKRYQ